MVPSSHLFWLLARLSSKRIFPSVITSGVGVTVGMEVGYGVGVNVAVGVAVGNGVGVGIAVGIGVGVGAAHALNAIASRTMVETSRCLLFMLSSCPQKDEG